ncbi:FAD-binding oxidoreductase [Mailhella massiliensis]|uniref:FAD-binding oxidoreductase n=1 Tax=Mailhella massiliensis TaxID=1903261 RepID=A0A921AWF0_9BACT|nr:FAD-binding oxidoreductase [Mailhella massiliensis]HJD97602.1 FAD-binding oxidoreductase [Mailhella massiliensis]
MRELYDIIPDRERVILENIPESALSDTLGRRRGKAEALVYPLSTEEVSAVMRFAWERRIPVTPRGAGTNLVGSTVPGGGIILDLSRMNRILEVDPETFTVTVEPGVLLEDLQARVEAMGLFYPPDPGEKTATLGGNISTNAGGMRAVKYGVTRDYVRGLTVVLANGDVMELGSKNVKDASGLNLKELIIGSEGTLAVITRCLLRLVGKPEASLTAVVPFVSLHEGIRSVPVILKAGLGPTAVEFVERSVVELGERFTGIHYPCPEADAYILLTFDGRAEDIEGRVEHARELVFQQGALDFVPLRDKEQAADIWRVRGCLVKAVEAISEQEPVDIVVPIDKIAEFVAYVHKVEKETGVQMVAFGHAGDGNVHLCVVRGNRSQEEWEKDLGHSMSLVYGEAFRLGGLTSGEHGIGVSKRPYYLSHTPEVTLSVQRSIKDALDERHILNDHKSYLR